MSSADKHIPSTMTGENENHPHPSSNLPSLSHKYTTFLSRIQSLETQIRTSTISKRRRAANLLDVVPTHRQSHMRLFISHLCSKKEQHHSRKWTLVIEGRCPIEDEAYEVIDSGEDDVVVVDSDSKTGRPPAAADTAPVVKKDTKPTMFTHFFDKMVVSFRKLDSSSPSPPPAKRRRADNSSSTSTPKSKRSHRNGDVDITTLTWLRQPESEHSRTEDAHAFHAIYEDTANDDDDDDDDDDDSSTTILASVSLYRRYDFERKVYRPSRALQRLLTHFEERGEKTNRSTDSGKKEKKKKSTSAAFSFSGNSRKKKKRSSGTNPPPAPPPLEEPKHDPTRNSHRIPQTLTATEAVSAVFIYVKEKNLQDRSDLSIVNNDDVLSEVFGCHRMLFSAVEKLLLERKLLVEVNREEDVIAVEYVMREDTVMPLDDGIEQSFREKDDQAVKRRSTAVTMPLPQMYFFDVSVPIPNPFHEKVRECLRRVKKREFEYTSSRTKAIKSLVSARADEDTVKTKVEDIVSDRGLTLHHVPVILSLVKNAPANSEARNSAQLDAKMAILLERLKERARMAKSCWEVVDYCQSVATRWRKEEKNVE